MAYKNKSKAVKLPKGFKEAKHEVASLPKVRNGVLKESYVGKKK